MKPLPFLTPNNENLPEQGVLSEVRRYPEVAHNLIAIMDFCTDNTAALVGGEMRDLTNVHSLDEARANKAASQALDAAAHSQSINQSVEDLHLARIRRDIEREAA